MFAVGLVTWFVTLIPVDFILLYNKSQCTLENFCPSSMVTELKTWGDIVLPIVISTGSVLIGLLWLSVAAFAFPMEDSKERFCAQFSPSSRAAIYLLGCASFPLLALPGILLPLRLGLDFHYDLDLLIVIITFSTAFSLLTVALLVWAYLVKFSSRCQAFTQRFGAEPYSPVQIS